MRQVLIRRGQVTVDQVPAPIVENGHLLVEVAYSLISAGTELSSVQSAGQSLVSKVLEQPERVKKLITHLRAQGIQKTIAKVQGQTDQLVPLGYSCSGIVVQVGDGISDFQPGDRVACAGAGLANHAEMVLVPRNLVAKVPEGCDLRSAASVTLGAIAMQGVRRSEPRLGEIIAVVGLGLLGQLTVQLLKAAGCRVIGLDVDNRRVILAQELGADSALNPTDVDVKNELMHLTAGYGVDTTVITAASNSDAIVQQAMEITRKKGRVVVVGAVGLGLKRSPFYEKELDFLISTSYGPGRYDERYEKQGLEYPYSYVRWTENRNMEEYLRLIAAGKLRLDKILEQEYALEEAEQAYADLQGAAEKPLGMILRYPMPDEAKLSDEKSATKVILSSKTAKGKIRIAVVGAGNFAKAVHLPNLQKLSDLYSIRAIVSSTGSNAKATAEQFGAAYASTNIQDVLDDPDVDAVMICTRHDLHAKQAMLAAKAGKAIFLEKPMALNQDELDQLVVVLKETGVPFMVGYNRRYSPAARRARELVTGRQNPLMILYRMNAGYLPPEHWTQTKEGGGRIIGEACHIIDLFQYLVDEPVVEVSATALAPKTQHVLAGDNVSATLRYADGSVATLLYTALGSTELNKEYMEVFVDGKVLALDDYMALHVYGMPSANWNANMQQKGHFEELQEFARFVAADMAGAASIRALAETMEISYRIATVDECK
ncbi:MAG: bi-domain-containing oxidoreductase [Caldilinea sp.]|nr:bi-domain-containing oxidoreductase [Caldilineaceae bacterium]MCW5840829.1 bi-domain-containing oxidoreductase [Caldilinea sp.]